VHSEFGPWWSLRAAVVFGTVGPDAGAPPATCSRCEARPCLPARERVEAATRGSYTRESFLAHWPLWLAMREACPLGRSARFGAQQVRYHYLKQLDVLRDGDG